MATKHPQPHNFSMRTTADDRKLLEIIREKLGITTDTQVVRMALRALAQKEGLKA